MPNELDQAAVDTFNWNILALCMGSYYEKIDKKTPNLFKSFIPIYQAGHMPCGWLGPIETVNNTFAISIQNGVLLIYLIYLNLTLPSE
ncbi:hypothetical protein GCM10027592_62910 [Spirosoma flavus]